MRSPIHDRPGKEKSGLLQSQPGLIDQLVMIATGGKDLCPRADISIPGDQGAAALIAAHAFVFFFGASWAPSSG
jgi:hypothetical protein